jgi:hypothetical protein
MAEEQLQDVPADVVLRRAFAPWHKRALGVAVGLTAAIVTAGATVFHVVAAPPGAPNLALLGEFYFGYTVTWPGVLIGAWWSFVVGFTSGWFIAFCVNFFQATWLLVVKARNDLSQTSDFLDHI